MCSILVDTFFMSCGADHITPALLEVLNKFRSRELIYISYDIYIYIYDTLEYFQYLFGYQLYNGWNSCRSSGIAIYVILGGIKST